MSPADNAVKGFQARTAQLAADDLQQEQALRLQIYYALALAEIQGLDTYSALLAALLVKDGATPDEAVRLAVEGYDLRVSIASQQAKDLLAHIHTELRVSTGEGTAEQRTYDMHDAEADRDRADYDPEPCDDDEIAELSA